MSVKNTIKNSQIKELRKHNASLIKDLRILSTELYNFVSLTGLIKDMVDKGEITLTKNDEDSTKTWEEITNALVAINELYIPSESAEVVNE